MSLNTDKLERFIEEHLKEDLNTCEHELIKINTDIAEFINLKATIDCMQKYFPHGDFKTQVNIGGNFFMHGIIHDTSKIFINIGCGVHLEFTLDEALKYIDFKLRVLNKQADVVREESIKVKANIKLTLMCIAENNNMSKFND